MSNEAEEAARFLENEKAFLEVFAAILEALVPELSVDNANRRFAGAEFALKVRFADGSSRITEWKAGDCGPGFGMSLVGGPPLYASDN